MPDKRIPYYPYYREIETRLLRAELLILKERMKQLRLALRNKKST